MSNTSANNYTAKSSGHILSLSRFINPRYYTVRQLLMLSVISYVGFSVYYTSQYEMDGVQMYHYTRTVSRINGYIATMYMPQFMRPYVYGLYSSVYGVDVTDFIGKFEDYERPVDFFTRRVKPRKIEKSDNVMLAPADSKILSISEVTNDSVFLVKGVNYSFTELVTGIENQTPSKDFLDKLKKDKKNKLYSVIYYLSPGDYHRYHSPAEINIKQRIHIAGLLWPVKPAFIEKNARVYETNERISIFSKWAHGLMNIVFVGATNVGSMTLDIEPELETNSLNTVSKVNVKKYSEPINVQSGDQMGMFKFGSTVVTIFEVPENFKFNIKDGDSVRFGDVVGRLN